MELLNDVQRLRVILATSILRYVSFDTMGDIPKFLTLKQAVSRQAVSRQDIHELLDIKSYEELIALQTASAANPMLLSPADKIKLERRLNIYDKVLSIVWTGEPEGDYWASISYEPIIEEKEKIPPFVVRKYVIAVSLGKKSISSIVDLAKFHDRFMDAIADASGLDDTVYKVDLSTISDHSLTDDVEYKDAFFVCHFLVFTKSSL